MKKFFCFIFFLVLGAIANAQTVKADVLKKTIEKLHSLKSISYKVNSTQNNPFNKGEVNLAIVDTKVIFSPNGTITYKKEHTNINSGQIQFQEIYFGAKYFSINLNDSTYTEHVPKSAVVCEMTEIASLIESELTKNRSKIRHEKDTIFEEKKCFNFLFNSYDTVTNGNHNYNHTQILINHETLLPVYVKNTIVGTAYKEGLPLGRLNIFAEKIFFDVVLNKKIKAIPFVNSGFSLPNTEMLKVGDKAPKLSLKTTSGMDTPESNFNGKLLLVVFGATGCAANPLANPMLNRIHSKFSSEKFNIINIYTNEMSEIVQKYIVNNRLEFPVYIGNRTLSKAFKTISTPNFYIISSEGMILRSSSGYKNSLEEDLTRNIAKFLEKKL